MLKRNCLLVIFLLNVVLLEAQNRGEIHIKTQETPLSQVLLDLKESYGFQFAFDSDLLANYPISVDKNFNTEEEALRFLLKGLPLQLEQSGDVFLIIPIKGQQKQAHTQISGRVLEARTYEPLPYSYIFINQIPVRSDIQGHFSYVASADTSFNVRISHLGYFVYDTVFTQSINHNFFLVPQITSIKEVKIRSNPVEKSTLIGDKAGQMKINHQIAPILPGHGDNSVFNLLRLMPGILAAGESSNDLLIWGSYESHSKIQLDGFTLFGLKNFNDNISVVNPFMVKTIEVMKGGYEARFGGRVGGIVDIVGKDGTLQKPTFTFNINSTTLNSMVQVPLSKKSTLMAAYRQTYYQLYDPTNINLFERKSNAENTQGGSNASQSGNSGIDFEVHPDYTFRDANLKYTWKSKAGSRFMLSLYGGGDGFFYNMNGELRNTVLTRTEEERNQQFGSSAQLNHRWNPLNNTRFLLSYSFFKQEAFEQNKTENIRWGKEKITKQIDSDNQVDEVVFSAQHRIGLSDGHGLILGIGGENNKVNLSRLFFAEPLIDIGNKLPRITAFVQDELPLGKWLYLKSGLRAVYAAGNINKIYFEPRVSASVNLTENFTVNAAWGLYNQFLSKTSVVDSSNNFSYFWINADDTKIPVLRAEHWVGGISYHKNGLTISTETYHKNTKGINRFFNGNKRIDRGFYQGNAKSYGLDFYIKKDYKRHTAWVSYTLSKTQEHFPFYVRDYYKPAPHHQTHELKMAAIVNVGSFYLSSNFVYGSGFERYKFELDDGTHLNQDYKRLDAAVVYRFKPGKVKAEAGISVLNVFNTDNIKYSNLRRATVDEVSLVGIYADAVPFSPTLFVKIEL
jgi:hypothetical protein